MLLSYLARSIQQSDIALSSFAYNERLSAIFYLPGTRNVRLMGDDAIMKQVEASWVNVNRTGILLCTTTWYIPY